MGSQAVNKKQ